ncbi:AraC family transcriptional regulator [Massilia sp. NR 4-1]|uniref:AraC family transcriptional regulator n=1 Tax=Massilia sp. NR 4-1 TaxID=1678028 RepID=UPI00067D5C20|nr:AraC family transcriptional regulator [Massilia sp. NR 4-1]AKU20331.1 AraC family transcriptional regulator [Massilia sp. NR 4-1]
MPSSPPDAPRTTAGRVAGSYLQPLLEAAAARGVQAAALEQAAGLDAGTLAPLPDALPADSYVRLLDAGAALCNDPHFGLHVGERVKLGTYSVYGLILLSCRDFGQALEQTMRYEQLAHDLGRSELRVADGTAAYCWHSHYPVAQRHLVDSVFAGIRVFGNWLAGQQLPTGELALMHDGGDPAGHGEYQRVLGTLPHFGASANIGYFDARMLQWPVPNADVSLYPVLQQHAEHLLRQRAAQAEADVVAQVRAAILRGLAQGQGRLAPVAEELKLSPRTLQRKLAEAGASFQQVLDQARFALAQDYLRQSGLSLVDIAFLLGFQEQSAFTHAFKEWSGRNPGAWREQALGA